MKPDCCELIDINSWRRSQPGEVQFPFSPLNSHSLTTPSSLLSAISSRSASQISRKQSPPLLIYQKQFKIPKSHGFRVDWRLTGASFDRPSPCHAPQTLGYEAPAKEQTRFCSTRELVASCLQMSDLVLIACASLTHPSTIH